MVDKYLFFLFDYTFLISKFVTKLMLLVKEENRVECENHQDCIADIDFHIRNLRNSAS
jgi:hypothetical protein